MKLYHYNTDKFDSILSLALRGMEKEGMNNDPNDPFAYNKSVSFFFAPIPRDIPSILEGRHPFWKEGQELYEYVVDTKDLPKNLSYHIVESREKTNLLFNEQDWSLVTEDTLHIKEKYVNELIALEDKLGYVGTGIRDLERAIRNTKYNYRTDYKEMVKLDKRAPYSQMFEKYAAAVPHVMLYVDKPITPETITKIVLGKPSKVGKWLR